MQKIETSPDGFTVTVVTQIDGAFHRRSFSAGMDVSEMGDDVVEHCAKTWTPDVVLSYNDMISATLPPPPTRDEMRASSLSNVDKLHAKFMRDLTGSATVEERDTWVSKSEAAKIVISLTDAELEAEIALVTSNHVDAADDLATLIFDVGDQVADVRAIAAVVHAKSLAYKRLIGFASKVRREAKAAVLAATDDAVPLEDVGAAIEAVNTTMMAQVAAAITAWQSS